MGPGKHTKAVEDALTAAHDQLRPADQPLIELARALAAQLDASGPEGPGTRLAGTYLTTLRTLAARTSTDGPAPRRRPSSLAAIRSQVRTSN
ncbi:hypothetical protein GCM10011509_10610 [Ornithinimicrobium pekingense]|uniref:Uncharacterized protein n=1 Tax=Ornithinimicrobium pekingense TaxID=384677 RepID=A0ABQ2F5K1_9MICO|nr:hypothetical protein GCM10011509_10610 [Ornithinimicrobium pekingense]